MNTVKLDKVLFEDNITVVTGASTCFSNLVREQIPTVDEVKKELSATIKRCRALGTKLKGQKAAKDLLVEIEPAIPELTKAYYSLYERHTNFWKNKVDQENMVIPDYDHDECAVAYEMRNQIMAMFYRSQPLSKLFELKYRLRDINDRLDTSDNHSSLMFGI